MTATNPSKSPAIPAPRHNAIFQQMGLFGSDKLQVLIAVVMIIASCLVVTPCRLSTSP
jgi:hypothetical protein